ICSALRCATPVIVSSSRATANRRRCADTVSTHLFGSFRRGRGVHMRTAHGLVVTLLVLLMPAVAVATGTAASEGQMTWGVQISLAPTWFDPAETSGIITPFMALYGLHDALVKPMPGNLMTPSLAETWTMSSNGLVYEFVLRKGVRFHNGD